MAEECGCSGAPSGENSDLEQEAAGSGRFKFGLKCILDTSFGVRNRRSAIQLAEIMGIPQNVMLTVGPEGLQSFLNGSTLLAQSQFFFNKLIEEEEYDDVEIVLSQLDPFATNAVTRCLFSGKLEVSPKTVAQVDLLIQVCIKFELKELEDICVKLRNELELENNQGTSSPLNQKLETPKNSEN